MTSKTRVYLYDIDDTEYEITGETFEVDLFNGRSFELDEIAPGGGTIRVRNLDRNFDPFFSTAASFLLMETGDELLLESGDRILLEGSSGTIGDYGAMMLGRKVIVKDGAVTVWTGFVEDYEYEYLPGRYAEATLTVRDALSALGRTSFLEWETTNNQYSGDRVEEAFARSEISALAIPSTISRGYVHLQGDTVTAGTNALTYLQTVTRTEYGRLFVRRDGELLFTDRFATFGVASSAAFNDLGTGLPFSRAGIGFTSANFALQVSVERAGGTVQTATNDDALAEWPNLAGRHQTISGLLFISDAYSLSLATYLCTRLSRPEAEVSELEVPLPKLSTVNRATVCGLDIGDVVTLDWTPTGAGDLVSQELVIEGWRYFANETGDARMTFELSDNPTDEFLIYDTDSYDSGKLYGF